MVIHRLFQTYRYGIVDANLRDEMPDHWTQQVIAPGFLGPDTARSPALLRTDALSDEEAGKLLDRLETEMQAQQSAFFSLLLDTEADTEGVARHLANRLVVRLERNGRPMQFRYFDPGTFVQLPSLLGDAGMNWLFGPINAVMVPWAGELMRYEKPQVPSTGFILTPHLPALLDFGVVNRAATELAPPANQQDWIDRCNRIRNHVRRARDRHRLSERDDLIAFAWHAESCHPRFDEHELMRNLFAQLAEADEEEQLDYCELTIGLGQETWDRIAHDLTENKTMEGMSS